jgi:CheY-like chemotaxis protein
MLKALVVEDEEDIKQLLVDELEGRGYQVLEAGNGVIAMQRVREQLPDIIFADVMLPVMDGFNLISKLRERRETAKIPVVLVTALNAHDTEGRAGKLGVKHHLTKPWEPWALDFVLGEAMKPDGRWSKEEAKYQVYPPKSTVHGNSSGRPRG